jgi:hypothetical protein
VVVAAAIGGTRPNRGDGEGAADEGEQCIKQKISYPWTAPGGAGGTEGLQRRALVASAHPAGRGDGDQRRHQQLRTGRVEEEPRRRRRDGGGPAE